MLAVAGVVGAYVLYLIVANGLLHAQVMPEYLEDEEESVRIHYRSAWSYWPGRVAAEDLRVAHQDSGLQTEFRAREATARIGLLDLLSKRVVISDLDAREVSVRVRGRRPAAEAQAAQVWLPPMLQWGPLALEDPGPTPKTDPEKLWHVVLEDTVGTVDEVWIEGVRITGAMAVSGSFDFMPMRQVIVDDVRMGIENGRVEAMGEEEPILAEGVAARLRFHIAGFDAMSHALPDLLRFADVDLQGGAEVFAGRVARAVAEVDAADGSGPLDVRVALRQGRFLRGSRAAHTSVHLDLTTEALRATVAGLDVAARATSDDDVALHGEAASVSGQLGPSRAAVQVERPSASVRLRLDPDFLHPSFRGGEAAVPASNVALTGLDGMSDAIRVRSGVGFLRGAVEADAAGKGTGEVHILLDGLEGAVHGVALAARSRSVIELHEVRVGDVTSVRATSKVGIDRLRMKAGDESVEDWSADLVVTSTLSRRGAAPWAIDAAVRGKLLDTRPGVAILDGGGFVPGIIADQLIAEDMKVDGKIEKRGSRLQIDVQDAKGDDLRIRGRLVSVPDDLRASFLVEALVNVGVSVAGGETDVQALAGEGWLARERDFLGGFGRGAATSETAPSETVR